MIDWIRGIRERWRLGGYAQELLAPRRLPVHEHPFRPEEHLVCSGIDFRVEEQLATLRRWAAEYPALWSRIRENPRINTRHLGEPYIHNGYFPSPDAEIYAAMIADHRPAHIYEIGSGFSTIVAKTTVDLLGLGTKIHVIDPQPRTDVRAFADSVTLAYVEDVPRLDVAEGSVVFIDSSHIARPGGDIPVLFCKLLPSVPKGTLIHVHDVFLPYDYPRVYFEWLYTEQYILHALLTHTTEFGVLVATYLLCRRHAAELKESLGLRDSHRDVLGASFWIRRG